VNRHQMITRTLMLESVAANARARAAVLRAELAEAARAELEREGTAPTWRLPDIGTVTLPVSTERVYVADEAALLAWVKAHASEGDPDDVLETIERVKPSYLAELLTLVEIVDGRVIDDLGTVVPGLAIRPGGVPQALSFRPSRDAQEVARAAAEKLMAEVEERLDHPVVLVEIPAPDA
jgi:hypothetical protein